MVSMECVVMVGMFGDSVAVVCSCRCDNSDTPCGSGGYAGENAITIGSGGTTGLTGTNNAGADQGGGPVNTVNISGGADTGGKDSVAPSQDYNDTRKGRYLHRLHKNTNEKE